MGEEKLSLSEKILIYCTVCTIVWCCLVYLDLSIVPYFCLVSVVYKGAQLKTDRRLSTTKKGEKERRGKLTQTAFVLKIKNGKWKMKMDKQQQQTIHQQHQQQFVEQRYYHSIKEQNRASGTKK